MGSRLKDKIAIISGAGSIGPGWGNGRATTVRFVEEGAKVFAVDRDAAALAETVDKAPGIATHLCDVTDAAAVSAMVQACVKKFGRVDILVNNVGGSAPGGPVEMSEEVWDAQHDLNLKSVFLACKHVLPVMERQGAGAIVNIASASGIRWSGSAQVAYAATKAGVIQLSRVVAVQYAPKGIRVNTVLPGLIQTKLAKAFDEETKARVTARTPVRRLGNPEDQPAPLVLAVAGADPALVEARLLTGGRLVRAGQPVWLNPREEVDAALILRARSDAALDVVHTVEATIAGRLVDGIQVVVRRPARSSSYVWARPEQDIMEQQPMLAPVC